LNLYYNFFNDFKTIILSDYPWVKTDDTTSYHIEIPHHLATLQYNKYYKIDDKNINQIKFVDCYMILNDETISFKFMVKVGHKLMGIGNLIYKRW